MGAKKQGKKTKTPHKFSHYNEYMADKKGKKKHPDHIINMQPIECPACKFEEFCPEHEEE